LREPASVGRAMTGRLASSSSKAGSGSGRADGYAWLMDWDPRLSAG